MGGHDAGTHHQFTGIAKYFNAYTITGRRNVSELCQVMSGFAFSSDFVFNKEILTLIFL